MTSSTSPTAVGTAPGVLGDLAGPGISAGGGRGNATGARGPVPGGRLFWTFLVTSVAAFMVSLDNLVVTNALPSIRHDLGAGLSGLEWTVNAYTLTFAVLLLPAAALGDRYGRRRVFLAGLTIFTAASAAAALAPGVEALVAFRAVQGAGAAVVLPLSLTLLSVSVPAERRGAALGVWGAASGLAVALGPLVGGAVTQGMSWQWIFWINVPIGLGLLPVAVFRLPESLGRRARLDVPGVVLAAGGLFGVVLGLVRAGDFGWGSTEVLVPIAMGGVLLAGFLVRERGAAEPVLPLTLFRRRAFSITNGISFAMSFGMFGAIFLLAQFMQTVQGLSPLEAGLRTLPWTGMPVLIAPLAGRLVDRIGGRPLLVTGLALQAAGMAWIAVVTSPTVGFGSFVLPFMLTGVGMSLFFVPVATVVMNSVPADRQGVASGTNSAIREVGGVFGVAVLATIFSHAGGYASGGLFVAGLEPALWVAVAVVAVGALVALALPGRGSTAQATPAQPQAAPATPVAVAASA